MATKSFKQLLSPLLLPTELSLLKKLNTANKVQDYLDHFPVNFSQIGEPVKSPRFVVSKKRAHCIEAAILAATSLAFNGKEAWLMDLRAANNDEDHVVCLFKEDGYYGAISKTNHAQLRWRDAIYKTPREVALSYFHEYFLFASTHFDKKVSSEQYGTKTLREYSKPFDITKFNPKDIWASTDLDWLAEKLDDSPHLPLVPKAAIKKLRKASKIEIKSAKLEEWKER